MKSPTSENLLLIAPGFSWLLLLARTPMVSGTLEVASSCSIDVDVGLKTKSPRIHCIESPSTWHDCKENPPGKKSSFEGLTLGKFLSRGSSARGFLCRQSHARRDHPLSFEIQDSWQARKFCFIPVSAGRHGL